MSLIYSIENNESDDLFINDLTTNVSGVTYYEHIVTPEEDMKLGLISKRLYGNSSFVEELSRMNNILNPYNVRTGDVILYCNAQEVELLREKDTVYLTEVKAFEDIINNTLNITVTSEGSPFSPTISQGENKYVLDVNSKTLKIITEL